MKGFTLFPWKIYRKILEQGLLLRFHQIHLMTGMPYNNFRIMRICKQDTTWHLNGTCHSNLKKLSERRSTVIWLPWVSFKRSLRIMVRNNHLTNSSHQLKILLIKNCLITGSCSRVLPKDSPLKLPKSWPNNIC